MHALRGIQASAFHMALAVCALASTPAMAQQTDEGQGGEAVREVAREAVQRAEDQAIATQPRQPIVRIVEGVNAPDVSVSVNRAVVLEAQDVFAEVSVANPEIADVAALSNRSIYILGKKPGRTTLTLLGSGGRLIANVAIRVAPDLAEFKMRLSEILPGEEIDVRSAADGLVLSGNVAGVVKLSRALELAERYAPGRVTNMMTVGGSQQVLLRVRFAEVQRQASKSLGFNWSLGFRAGDWGGDFSTGDYLQPGNDRGVPVRGGLTADYQTSQPTESVMRIGYAAGGLVANLAIDALEGKGAARTLAEPNLTALSGDTASFLAGGEYPVPVFEGDDGAISVDYKPFGVSLGFTPTVLDDGLINLEVQVEKSIIDKSIVIQNQGVTYNGFATRRARTTIELRDSQSFAIAGLLEEVFIDNASQIPWIGDVPVLGALFRSADFQRNLSELVIIVTVNLVSPAVEEALDLPTNRIEVPSERELFLYGLVESQNNQTVRNVAMRDFEGAFGYVVE